MKRPCNIKRQNGMTLIELLIVLAIISILAAFAAPGYIGLQERARKAAVIRSAAASESEIQGWLNSAIKGLAGEGTWGMQNEVDSNGDGAVKTDGTDFTNSALGSLLTEGTLCTRYVSAKYKLQPLRSPWGATTGSLWVSDDMAGAATSAGAIVCSDGPGITSVIVTAKDARGQTIHLKKLYTD